MTLRFHPMSEAEARGFRLACAAMAHFGDAVAAQATLPGPAAEPLIPESRLRAHVGRQAAAMARALEQALARPLPGR